MRQFLRSCVTFGLMTACGGSPKSEHPTPTAGERPNRPPAASSGTTADSGNPKPPLLKNPKAGEGDLVRPRDTP